MHHKACKRAAYPNRVVVRLPMGLEEFFEQRLELKANRSDFVRAALRKYEGPVWPTRAISQVHGGVGAKRLPIRVEKAERRRCVRITKSIKRTDATINALAISAVCAALGCPMTEKVPEVVYVQGGSVEDNMPYFAALNSRFDAWKKPAEPIAQQ